MTYHNDAAHRSHPVSFLNSSSLVSIFYINIYYLERSSNCTLSGLLALKLHYTE